jgi:SPP1 gp7 family putative phage head morphogenesis protein
MPIEPRHGQYLPVGDKFARALRAFDRLILEWVLPRLDRRTEIPFNQFEPTLRKLVTPFLADYFGIGASIAEERIRSELARLGYQSDGDGKASRNRLKTVSKATREAIEKMALNLADSTMDTVRTTVRYVTAQHRELPYLEGKTDDGKKVGFVPHPWDREDDVTLILDPKKIDQEWSLDGNYYIPPGGGGGEIEGRRDRVREYIDKGKPLQASRAVLGDDGRMVFEDGRHRFSVLRDDGYDRVAITVPREQANEFLNRYQSNQDALVFTRDQLLRSINRGESIEQMTRRVGKIFRDPKRARMIAATESSRAVHAGRMHAAKEAGVTKTEWLANSGACPRCEALNGKQVEIGKPFDVTGSGPYARTYHPPLHPRCGCGIREMVEPGVRLPEERPEQRPALPPQDQRPINQPAPTSIAPGVPVATIPPSSSGPVVKPSPLQQPHREPQGITVAYVDSEDRPVDPKRVEAVKQNIFGREVTDQHVAAMGNAFDGSHVKFVVKDNERIDVYSEGKHGEYANRQLVYDRYTGEVIVANEAIKIPRDSPLRGHGFEVFANQVQALREGGVSRIVNLAAGSKIRSERDDSQNGYYTWPRLGYDGDMSDEQFARLPMDLRNSMADSRSVLDLYEKPGGKEAWKEHGSDIALNFDLMDGSRSLKTLGAYIEERRERGK